MLLIYTRFKNKARTRLTVYSAIALVLQLMVPFMVSDTHAGSLSFTLVRFNRMKINTFTAGTVCAKPATAGTEASVKVTFPTGYALSATGADYTTNTTNTGWPKDPSDGTTTATAWPTIANSATVSGQDVTWTSGDLTVATWYCFNWTNTTSAVKTKTSTGTDLTGVVTTQASGPSTIDTGNYATAAVTDDQIAVTATVNSTFSFSLSSNAAALGVLSTGSPTAATAINATVSTNAQKGWNMWAADPAGTPGLTSTTASKTIAYSPTVGSAAATLSAATEGFNLGAGANSGTCNGSTTIDANFASGGVSFKGGGLDNTLRILAVSTGTAASCVVPLTVNASISGTTPAASDYAATMTVVAAGRF